MITDLAEPRPAAPGRSSLVEHAGGPRPPGAPIPDRLAYVISRFPLVSETFILREIEELRRRGWEITLIPLLRHRPKVRHGGAERWEREAWYTPFLSPGIVWANLRSLVTRPGEYLGLLREIVVGTWRCPNFLVGAIGIFPKSVYLAERVRRSGIRHVHAHYLTHPTVAALIIGRLAGAGFSATGHAHDLYVHQAMLRAKVERAAFIVVISEFNRRFIAAHVGPACLPKVQVVHCGVDPAVFAPTPLPPGGPLRILAVGSLQPYKGLKYLVRACGVLKQRGLPFACRIIGDGELRVELAAEIRHRDLGAEVQLLGAQPQEVVARELAAAHVLALSSIVAADGKMEGIPVVLMEALASGRPVVAARISGIPELVRHEVTGLLVEPEDPDGLADALQRLAGDPALVARLTTAGRALIEEEFTVTDNVDRLERLFRVAVDTAREAGR